jgi:hypothetical protein
MVIEMHSVCFLAIGTLSCLLGAGVSMRHYTRRALRRAIRLAALATTIPGYHDMLPRLREEIDRARRHGHSLTVVSIDLPSGDTRESVASEARVLAIALTGAIVRDARRAEDLLAFDAAGGRYLLLLPESSTTQALAVIRRLEAVTRARAGLRIIGRVAEFPRDGLTIEQLYRACTTLDASGAPLAMSA